MINSVIYLSMHNNVVPYVNFNAFYEHVTVYNELLKKKELKI